MNSDTHTELWQTLNQLIDRDVQLALRVIPLVSIRSTLRVLPMVAWDSHIDFWKQDKGDRRVEYLAAVIKAVEVFDLLRGFDYELLFQGKPSVVTSSLNSVRQAIEDTSITAASGTPSSDIRNGAYKALVAAKSLEGALLAISRASSLNDLGGAQDSAKYAVSALLGEGAIPGPRQIDLSINGDLYAALKRDIEDAFNLTLANISDFSNSLLWHEIPEWYVESVHKLIGVIGTLPRSEEQSLEWGSIEVGVDYLKRYASIKDENTTNAAASKSNTSDKARTLFSFEANNQSHPEIPAKTDKLNRQKLVHALATNLVSPTNSHHRAIGLLGEWGAGKSTVLDLLKQRLKELNAEQPFIFGEFNAWSYEHTDNIQAGVAQEIIKALTSPQMSQDHDKSQYSLNWPWLKMRAKLTWGFACKAHPWQLLKVFFLLFVVAAPWLVTWMESLINEAAASSLDGWGKWLWIGGFGLYLARELGKLVMNPHAKELLTYLRLPNYAEHLGKIPVMRENIHTLCDLRLREENGKKPRMLFLVDDLDRCSPSAIVKVLEAVRLVLDLDNVIVIIAIDQHIALAALSEYFKDFSPHHKLKNSHAIAREYLSKVINLPIVLTKPSSDDVKIFMGSFWDEMNKEVDKEMSENNKSEPETAEVPDSSSGGDMTATDHGVTDRENNQQDASPVDNAVPDTAAETFNPNGNHPSVEKSVPSPVIKPIKALSKDQQESFIYWVNYFELSNSRQLKRLNNSYDLMRCYLPLLDKEAIAFALTESQSLTAFPMLLTLILMEYLNSLHDLSERNHLWKKLFATEVEGSFESTKFGRLRVKMTEFDNTHVTPVFIKAYRSLLAAEPNTHLLANVEAFVLPAMN